MLKTRCKCCGEMFNFSPQLEAAAKSHDLLVKVKIRCPKCQAAQKAEETPKTALVCGFPA